MPKIAIVTGVLLTVLGLVFYFVTAQKTAIIPVPIGLMLAGSGGAALHPARVKAGMHAAAMFGLLGLLGSLMGVPKWIAFLRGAEVTRPLGALEQFFMFIICLVFVVLCVRWFISNRRARIAA